MTSRRLFLRAGSASIAVLSVPKILFAAALPVSAELKLLGGQGGPTVPGSFMGLSYENMQLEDETFFSPENKGLIEAFKAIAPHGVLRLGGNTSEFGWWKATPEQAAPRRFDSARQATGEPTAATTFAITPQAIDNLAGFLQAAGWSCIYGLNLGYGTAATDVPEAVYVYDKLGSHLEYFQIGNEVDLFSRHLRDPETWNPRRYLKQWLVIADAVHEALPMAKFGLPDVAANVSWLPQIAALWPTMKPQIDNLNVVTMSHHYYWSGPPSNPDANVANLMKPDPRIKSYATMAQSAAHELGPDVTWRMTEGNTIFRGGKDGVSDVFASALWAADYLLQLMSLGYSGVNLHGGSGHAQAVSVGGVFVGEALMNDPTVPHPKPFYTPIANEGTLAGAGVDGKLNGIYLLEPVGYGMEFVVPFVGATMIPVEFSSGSANATAYAATKEGKTMVAIVNKDASSALTLKLPGYAVLSVLTAGSLDSRKASLIAAPLPARLQAQVAPGKHGRGNTMVVVPAHTALLLEMKNG
jgi:hypothetical protein